MKYVLDPGSTKFTCPNCEKWTLVRYIEADTKQYLEGNFGRCDREEKCGFWEFPPLSGTKCHLITFKIVEDFSEKAVRATDLSGNKGFIPKSLIYERNENSFFLPEFFLEKSKFSYLSELVRYFDREHKPITEPIKQNPKPPEKPISFIPAKLFEKSLQEYEQNNFIQYLSRIFPGEVVSNLIAKYFIGTSKHQFTNPEHPGYKSEPGAVVFWQIDFHGKIRSGKIMLYNLETGKRVKQPFNHVSWVHNRINHKDFNLKQCFFGEHLLKGNTLPVAIVESEKTAIIASAYLPQFVWIATGAKNGLQADKCKILLGRNVTLWPDCKAFTDWEEKAKSIPGASVKVSRLLEDRAAPDHKELGYDLSDYLTMINYQTFIQPSNSEPEPQQANEPESELETQPEVKTMIQPLQQTNPDRRMFPKPEPEQVGNWTNEISELEPFFAAITLPQPPVRLNSHTTITNPQLFVENHLSTIRAQNGKKTFLPYLKRLQELKSQLAVQSL